MRPIVFIACLILAALLGAAIALRFGRRPDAPAMDPHLVSALDSLISEDARKDTLINALMNAPPVTIRIREQLPISSGLGLDTIKSDLLADPL